MGTHIVICVAYTQATRTRGKYRVVYNDSQRSILENEFINRNYITTARKQQLAKSLGLSERQV